MQRVTITIDDDLTAELERYMAMHGYANRSEAIRDLGRAGLQQNSAQVGGPGHCVAALIYVYDHHQRELPKRLTRDFHDHHDLAQATIHVHLDHEQCMEVTVLKGRGVRHGKIVYLPGVVHDHEDSAHSHGHRATRGKNRQRAP